MQYLLELVFSHSSIDDESFGCILEAISRGNFPVLDHLDFSHNNFTTVGICYLWTKLGQAARQRLRKLNLGSNYRMLDHLDSITLFIQNILLSDAMNVKNLNVSRCGKHTTAIIKACECDKNKLQKLDISRDPDEAAIREQLTESWPRMKRLTHLVCDYPIFDLENRLAMLKALRKNTSIVELTLVDISNGDDDDDDDDRNEACLLIAVALKRNQIMQRADALLALQPTTGMPIRTESGLWCNAFAAMSTQNVEKYIGASAIFKILQQRPTLFFKPLQQPAAAAEPNAALPPRRRSCPWCWY
jgi:hypothetical protein